MIRAEDYDLLIACECSGVVRDAMRKRGIRAISADVKPTQRPGPHYRGDVRDILHLKWPALIAHPECTFLTNAGVKHLYVDGREENGRFELRWRAMRKGAKFFRMFLDAKHIPLRAVENPIPHCYARELMGGRATQYIQPWWFGSPLQKATGLHLVGFAPLPREREKSSYALDEIRQEVFLMAPSDDRSEKRSKTDPQIARAMAQYWAPEIKELRRG